MNRDTDRSKMFGRRAAVLGFAKLGLLGVLAGRMYYLQVIEGSRYATLADENRINIRLLPPPRGRILDRFGLPLAENETNYRALIVAEDTGKAGGMKATLDRLAKIVDISPKEIQRVMREAKRRRSFVPIKVVENLTWEDVASIQVNSPDLPGVDIDVGQSRNYPHGETLAHVLGYVAQVSEKDLTGDPLLELPGFRIGKAGVEKVHDLALRGAGGHQRPAVLGAAAAVAGLDRQRGALQLGRLQQRIGRAVALRRLRAGLRRAPAAMGVPSEVLCRAKSPAPLRAASTSPRKSKKGSVRGRVRGLRIDAWRRRTTHTHTHTHTRTHTHTHLLWHSLGGTNSKVCIL